MDEKKTSGDLTLGEIIVEIRHELEEDQLFLQGHYRLWETGDGESAAVDERFRHVLLLTSIMDELLSALLTEEGEKLGDITVPKNMPLVSEEAEPADAEEEEAASGPAEEEEADGEVPPALMSADESNPELRDLRYTIHTVGSPDGAESVEEDWAYDWPDRKPAAKQKKKGKKNKKSKKSSKECRDAGKKKEESCKVLKKDKKSKKKNKK